MARSPVPLDAGHGRVELDVEPRGEVVRDEVIALGHHHFGAAELLALGLQRERELVDVAGVEGLPSGGEPCTETVVEPTRLDPFDQRRERDVVLALGGVPFDQISERKWRR